MDGNVNVPIPGHDTGRMPRDYSGMLERLQRLNWLFTAGLTLWFLLMHRDWMSTLGERLPPLADMALYVLIPAVVGLFISYIVRAVKVHDKIATLFRMRHDFDVHHIIIPLAGEAGVPIGLGRRQSIRQQRKRLISKIFYKYASSTDPRINGHLIETAMDRWSWLWAVVELNIMVYVFAVLFVSTGSVLCSLICLAINAMLIPIEALYYRNLYRFTEDEIASIIELDGALDEIRAALTDALPD